MKHRIITHIVFFFLLIYSSDNLYSAYLYEEQIYNLGRSYEKKGQFNKALSLYKNYLANNEYSERIAARLNKVKRFTSDNQKKIDIKIVVNKKFMLYNF